MRSHRSRLLPFTLLLLFATWLGAFAACVDDPSPPNLIASPEVVDAPIEVIDPEPVEECPLHGHGAEELSGEDDCCGCHYFATLECAATCDPDPEEIDPAEVPTVGGNLERRVTYYRIGHGVEPREGEYEFLDGQSGEDGKIKKNGGTNMVGVSFYTTQADAEAARTRIGSTGKIHKVSSFPSRLITFVGRQPPPNHVHAVPAKEMTLKEFRAALKKIKLTKVE